ncbi:DNA-3-methyladenine glycosylase family protein [Aquipseudomonas guryensis]|jgi:DNA-3-methyladenine glycosylase II|uniref:DNA-3-methyladenine glycosylase II n=1 Tax=Aquipseudomonas guryensis TaxID=2759165 RepID=A0A7W4D8M0_9GAMM|nr:DNA-3-methyladenine glycosylase 2 family protein [Pseudomonas guryensis]MBB1518008.1 DNA-3-methyladenine glycosylase 2 family protein [Pseudomonas guryensis]
MSRLDCSLELPTDYRVADLLAFHRRDGQALAERVRVDGLDKGVLWQGLPACLSIRFDAARVTAHLVVDGPVVEDADPLRSLVVHMLGLTQPVRDFETAYAGHPQLGPLLARHAGLRVPQAATPFEALSWAISGQQISLPVAISLRRKLIQLAGRAHSSGLFCYPDAQAVAALQESQLRAAGFSQAKAQTLLLLSREIVAGHLPLDTWLADAPAETIAERLLALRGIGPWTVDYALLRGFARLDGSLHGDAAVRRQLQRLLGSAEKLSQPFTRDWLAPLSPWRALVAAHLWAMPSTD